MSEEPPLEEGSVDDQVAAFAQEVELLLNRALPGGHTIVSRSNGRRYEVTPLLRSDQKPTAVPLFVDGERLAALHLEFRLMADSSGRFLKTTRADFRFLSALDSNPLARLEFQGAAHSAPAAHWHIHGERGALAHLLARANAVRRRTVRKPHEMSSLHFPVGGERFRPGLEDAVAFAICELGVDSVSGWAEAVQEMRERWRRRQVRTVVRDAPSEAARTLRALGWRVTEPDAGAPEERTEALTRW